MDMWYLPEMKQCTDSSQMLSLANRVTASKLEPIVKQCCQATGWHDIGKNLVSNAPLVDPAMKLLIEKCLSSQFTSEEWYKNCDRLFIQDRRTNSRLVDIEQRFRIPG